MELECEVVTGGTLLPHKGINVPQLKIHLPDMLEKDKK